MNRKYITTFLAIVIMISCVSILNSHAEIKSTNTKSFEVVSEGENITVIDTSPHYFFKGKKSDLESRRQILLQQIAQIDSWIK